MNRDASGARGGGGGGDDDGRNATTPSSAEYPDYAEEERLLTEFLTNHTVLVHRQRRSNRSSASDLLDSDDDSDDDDDDALLEPGENDLQRISAYVPYLQCLRDRRSDSTNRGSPVLQIPLDELVAWDSIRGADLAGRITRNAKRYVDILCGCIDSAIDGMTASADGGGGRGRRGRRDPNVVRDSIDILQEQRLAQHEREAARRAAESSSTSDVNGPLGGGGLENDPNAVTPPSDDNAAAQGAVNEIPAVLLRRYEVRVLPRGRKPAGNCLGLNFPVRHVLAPRKSLDGPEKENGGLALRNVRSGSIGRLVSLRGMLVRCSDVKPQCLVATYTCDRCGAEIYQEIAGQREFLPHRTCPVQSCATSGNNNGPSTLFLQTRGSRFAKFQEVKLQELPSQVPVGHVPRCMPVHCRGELTRQASPGDVVTIDGIFLPARGSDTGGFAAMKAGLLTTTYLDATNVVVHKKSYDDRDSVDLAEREELRNAVLAVAHGDDPVGRLSSSIAPEIFGHDDVKRALLLQLVGGCERKLPDGMRIRGDVNICLMGDPGVAKSQLLKYISTVAPRGVYTTGRGSSGVGLTAAITKDAATGDMALEGGALVLADRGVCCIDEFDKMDENDRTAIHEVMEQQTVSVAKAGIVATLNARAAVLAAANPLWGRYNRRKSLSENINLPNSLLSRFDLMFLILDVADADRDVALARHVTFVHRHNGVTNTETDGDDGDDAEDADGDDAGEDTTEEGTRRNRGGGGATNVDGGESTSEETAGGGGGGGDGNRGSGTRPLDPKVVTEYISTARQFHPVVPPDVAPYIVEAYVGLRMQDANNPQGAHGGGGGGGADAGAANNGDQTVMTARQLLSILRLGQALARLRFSDYVAREDVDEAIRLTHMSKASLLDRGDDGGGGGGFGGAGSGVGGGGAGGRGGGGGGRYGEDVTSRIFHILRDYATATASAGRGSSGGGGGAGGRLEVRTCEAMVLRKGFTVEQLRRCLEEYEALNVLQVNATGTHIDFLQEM